MSYRTEIESIARGVQLGTGFDLHLVVTSDLVQAQYMLIKHVNIDQAGRRVGPGHGWLEELADASVIALRSKTASMLPDIRLMMLLWAHGCSSEQLAQMNASAAVRGLDAAVVVFCTPDEYRDFAENAPDLWSLRSGVAMEPRDGEDYLLDSQAQWIANLAETCRCCDVCGESPCGGCQQGAPCDASRCTCEDEDAVDSEGDDWERL